MKKIVLLVLLQLLFVNFSYGMVKLKDVSQKVFGSTGAIRVEFNGNYKESKVEVDYKSDHVEILMRDAFTLPANRVFKVSSEKSSVSKITSKLTPGNLIKLSVYFRTPIDVIQKTGKVSVDKNVLTFSYKTVADATLTNNEEASPNEKEKEKTNTVAEQKDGKPLDAYYQAMNQPQGIEDNGSEKAVVDNPKKEEKAEPQSVVNTYSSSIKKLWTVLKGALILILVVAFSVVVFYLYKRYSSGMTESMKSSFGRAIPQRRAEPEFKDEFKSAFKMQNKEEIKTIDTKMKVLSSLELNHGKTIHVVEYMGEKMLIGTSKENVTMLSRLDGKQSSLDEPDLFKNAKFKDRFGSDF